MKQTLEEITKGKKVLIDSCAVYAFKPEMPYLLNRGVNGLNNMDEVDIEKGIRLLEEISRINGRLIMIGEVYQEVEKFRVILNRYLQRTEAIVFDRNDKNMKMSGKSKRALSLLSDLYYKVHELLKNGNGTDPLNELSFKESEQCLSYLDMAQDLFPFVQQGPATFTKNSTFGRSMHTDETLVATAFFLSHNYDVAILTRDLGVQNLAIKLAEFIDNEEISWQYNLPKVNRKSIACIYPNPKNEEKIMSCIYPSPSSSSTSPAIQSQTSSALELFL